MNRFPRGLVLLLTSLAVTSLAIGNAFAAQPFVPGTGECLEDLNRSFRYPKSGKEHDKKQQGELMPLDRRLARGIPIAWQPSCTVRVYLPPFEQWENRNGPQFEMRADCQGRDQNGKVGAYSPGMRLLLPSETSRGLKQDSARLTVRGDKLGRDFGKLDITEPGWWTLGLSFTSDGQVHYYASPGVDDLTSDDYLVSNVLHSMRCFTLNNYFFFVADWEDESRRSTQWVVDDAKIFVQPPPGQQVADLYRKTRPATSMRSQHMRGSTARPRRNHGLADALVGAVIEGYLTDEEEDKDYRDERVLKREGIKPGSKKHKELLYEQDLYDDHHHLIYPTEPKKKRISRYLTPQ
jgi:hypothetical protein